MHSNNIHMESAWERQCVSVCERGVSVGVCARALERECAYACVRDRESMRVCVHDVLEITYGILHACCNRQVLVA